MRITGLATGLDMDQIIKDSMKPYRIKIDQQQQKKEILELKQKLYRDVLKDMKGFNDKYFDLAKSDSLMASSNWSTVKFTSSDESVATATSGSAALKDNYKVTVDQMATSTETVLKMEDLTDRDTVVIKYKEKELAIDISKCKSEKELATTLNKELKSLGMEAQYSEFTGGVTVKTTETGSANDFKLTIGKKKEELVENPEKPGELIPQITYENEINKGTTLGKNLKATIENSAGHKIVYDDVSGKTQGSNKIVIDGITIDITSTGTTKLTGKTDATGLKDKIVGFVNDYNSIIEKLNKHIYTKGDKSYTPLTEEQKKEMSEEEIKLWNKKVEEGQLYRDSDLTRIVNTMKRAMSDMVSGSGLSLEDIGISPVADYQAKNGMFTIDEKKLEAALEKNPDEIRQMFIGQPSGEGLTEAEKYNKSGIMVRLKDVLNKEAVLSKSPLSQKAGYEGTSTASENTISKSLEQQKKKIAELERDFKRREQALYSKYARLEVAMNNYNSQQSYLMQQLG